VGLGKIRLERERFFEALDRLLSFAEAGERDGEAMVRLGLPSLDLIRAAEQRHRVGKAALLQADEAEPMNGAEMPIVGLEHSFIMLRRFRQPALLVAGDRLRERFEYGAANSPLSRAGMLAHGAVLRARGHGRDQRAD